MSETELQKEIMKAVHKVNKMNINMGQSQYMGRGEGEESSEEVEVKEEVERVPENIYDKEEDNQFKAVKGLMKDILKRSEYINEGEPDLPKLAKQLRKVKDTMGGMSAGKAPSDLKNQLKALKAHDPKLYYKVKAKLDAPGKKSKKPKGGAKVKKPASEKQKAWMAMVDKVKAKHPELTRKECMKIASEKRKAKGGLATH